VKNYQDCGDCRVVVLSRKQRRKLSDGERIVEIFRKGVKIGSMLLVKPLTQTWETAAGLARIAGLGDDGVTQMRSVYTSLVLASGWR